MGPGTIEPPMAVATDLQIVPDAVGLPPIHAESYHVATDKDPSK